MKCPHCGVHYMEEEKACPICGIAKPRHTGEARPSKNKKTHFVPWLIVTVLLIFMPIFFFFALQVQSHFTQTSAITEDATTSLPSLWSAHAQWQTDDFLGLPAILTLDTQTQTYSLQGLDASKAVDFTETGTFSLSVQEETHTNGALERKYAFDMYADSDAVHNLFIIHTQGEKSFLLIFPLETTLAGSVWYPAEQNA